MVDWPLGPSRAGAGNELGLSRSNIAASQTTGADLGLIAYRGGAPLLTELIGNHIPAGQSVLSDYPKAHRSGLVKVLGVNTEKRWRCGYPDLQGAGLR
jgi:tripartite-type tricarboxylate transporter receptor subunit TctC